MFYNDQLQTPSFPIGLVKTESGFIVTECLQNFTFFSLSFCKKYILFTDNKAKYYTIFPK